MYDSRVSRHPITRAQQHDIARDYLPASKFSDLSFTSYLGFGCRHLHQGLHSAFRPGLLNKTDDGVEQQYSEDHRGIDVVPHGQRYDGGNDENVDEWT